MKSTPDELGGCQKESQQKLDVYQKYLRIEVGHEYLSNRKREGWGCHGCLAR
jgi:hypothetical protein